MKAHLFRGQGYTPTRARADTFFGGTCFARSLDKAVACGGRRLRRRGGKHVLWALSGPLFGFSDTWQLIVNTATTVTTFLVVFVIQNIQNRDSEAT